MTALVPLSTYIQSVEAGRSFGSPAPPAGPNDWGIIKVSAMTWGQFRPDENKTVPEQLVNPKFEIRQGDLLVSRANTSEYVGAPVVVGPTRPRLLLSDKSMRLAATADADTNWLRYMLMAPQARCQIEARATGTSDSMRNISQASLLALDLPSATLPDQRQTVELLDDHFSRLDAADAYLTASIDRLPTIRLARLREIRRHLLKACTPTIELGSAAETSLGKMLDSKKAVGEPTPYLRNINVRWGSFDLSDVKSVPLRTLERERFALLPGDLLVCEGGEPGRCAVWPGSVELMTFQKALHRVRVDTAILRPEFVAAMLELIITEPGAQRLFTGTTIKHLPQERLRQIELPLPTIEEQDRVISELGRIRSQVDRLRGALETARSRSRTLRRDLLDAAFSGQLTRRTGDRDGKDQFWRPVDIDALILDQGTKPADFDQPWFDATEQERADLSEAVRTM